MFSKLNFPEFEFNIQKMNDNVFIFDKIRKKLVKLTPEEWVRQHVLSYLLEVCHIPLSRIAVEKQLEVHGRPKRFDVAVFEKKSIPLMLIECKSPTVAIDQKVFEQAVRYNMSLQVPYLWLTNGLHHVTIECDHKLQACRTIAGLPPENIWK